MKKTKTVNVPAWAGVGAIAIERAAPARRAETLADFLDDHPAVCVTKTR